MSLGKFWQAKFNLNVVMYNVTNSPTITPLFAFYTLMEPSKNITNDCCNVKLCKVEVGTDSQKKEEPPAVLIFIWLLFFF